MKIVISSAHALHVRGAAGYLDEVDESRRMVKTVAELLRSAGVKVVTFNDDTSKTQSQNLKTIVDFHNKNSRDLDCSIHFNAFSSPSAHGTEVLYVTQQKLAAATSAAISRAGGFHDRKAKRRDNLYFLNKTTKPSVLLEICFVTSSTDAGLYQKNYARICKAVAETIGGVTVGEAPPPPDPGVPAPPEKPFDQLDIKCSVFGGSKDPNKSAYPPYDTITDKEVSCALPHRFKGDRPMVLIRNRANGWEAMCLIRDIGPWNLQDEYWATGKRPLAETYWKEKKPLPSGPNKGRVPNGAGIDITPAAAKAIGLSGMGQIDWRFIDPDEAATD